MFLIKRVKKFPIFDLFLKKEIGWQGWSRIILTKNQITHLGGRKLSSFELSQAKERIISRDDK